MIDYIEYICAAVCFFSCAIHFIVSFFNNSKLNKRIDKLCMKCGKPESEHSDFDHEFLTSVADSLGYLYVLSASLPESASKSHLVELVSFISDYIDKVVSKNG